MTAKRRDFRLVSQANACRYTHLANWIRGPGAKMPIGPSRLSDQHAAAGIIISPPVITAAPPVEANNTIGATQQKLDNRDVAKPETMVSFSDRG